MLVDGFVTFFGTQELYPHKNGMKNGGMVTHSDELWILRRMQPHTENF